MKQMTKLTIGLVAGLALLTGVARADLVLSGTTAGYFQGVSSGDTVINNSVDGSLATFLTGVPIEDSFKSGVQFNGDSFTNIQSGDSFAFGLLTYFNGRTEAGTSSANAMLDFYVDLSDPAVDPFLLTTITFGIDATVQTPDSLVPDFFTASFTQPAPVLIGGQWVQFSITGLPTETAVMEDSWVELAEVTVTYFNPVPEPSTYGMIGAAGLLGLVAFRRHRGRQAGAHLSLTAAA